MNPSNLKIEIQMEPADRSVGIMSEGFVAWNLEDGKAWCELTDYEVPTFTWYDTETNAVIPRPPQGEYVEACLAGYVHAYYKGEEAGDKECEELDPLQIAAQQKIPARKRVAAKFPETAEDWQLYCARECGKSRASLDAAAKDLTEGLKQAIETMIKNVRKLGLKNPMQIAPVLRLAFDTHAEPPMKKHRSLGAWDTEPRAVAFQAMIDAAKKEIGREGERIPELGEL